MIKALIPQLWFLVGSVCLLIGTLINIYNTIKR